MPESQQHRIRATSATYTKAHATYHGLNNTDRWLQSLFTSPHTHSCAAYSLNTCSVISSECISAVQAQMCHQIITDTSSGFQARYRCFMHFYWPQRHILVSNDIILLISQVHRLTLTPLISLLPLLPLCFSSVD